MLDAGYRQSLGAAIGDDNPCEERTLAGRCAGRVGSWVRISRGGRHGWEVLWGAKNVDAPELNIVAY